MKKEKEKYPVSTAPMNMTLTLQSANLCYQLLCAVSIQGRSPNLVEEARAVDAAKKEIEAQMPKEK